MTEPSQIDRIREELGRLTAIDGVSGHEGAVVRYLRGAMEPLVDRVEVDAMGNLYAYRDGGTGPHLMVEAHSDEIGALVSAVEPDGFLRFQPVGGTTEAGMIARKVRVAGRSGVVGIRPGHLSGGDTRSLPPFEDFYIDLGFDSREQVLALGIRPGDQIVADSELTPLANPNRVAGKGIDNRLGCLIVLELLRSLNGEALAGPLSAVIAVQEEVGLRGAQIAAQHVRPDVAAIVDTVPCADTPDSASVHTFPVGLGRGPVFQVSSGRHASGHILSEPIRAYLITLAERARIPYQLATFAYGTTDGTAIAAEGVPTAVVTIPRRYSHSPVETLDLNDALATLRLFQEMIKRVEDFPRESVTSVRS